jgi:signal transduction histidine kinase
MAPNRNDENTKHAIQGSFQPEDSQEWDAYEDGDSDPVATGRTAAITENKVRNLAHDTRNWLTALQVYCDLVRMSPTPEEFQVRLDELSGAVERSRDMVGPLLDFLQRANFGERDIDDLASHPRRRDRRWDERVTGNPAGLPPLDLLEVLRRQLPPLERIAGARIHIELDLPAASSFHAAIPESDFLRILHNLVLNAIEAMPKGGRLRIALRGRSRAGKSAGEDETRQSAADKGNRRRGDRRLLAAEERDSAVVNASEGKRTVLLRVYDTGEGIAPDLLPHIFEPGFSDKAGAGETFEFRGYGLPSVRELVEERGGSVRVRSRMGRGSCFEVELPRV